MIGCPKSGARKPLPKEPRTVRLLLQPVNHSGLGDQVVAVQRVMLWFHFFPSAFARCRVNKASR